MDAWAVSVSFDWRIVRHGQPVNLGNYGGFHAFHPTGANVAFADGSARLLKSTTAPAILTALTTRESGEPAEEC